ncbi:MAG: hypothetical protein AAF685_01865 [Cyanobacteria bacterium P01_C01_bin.89]
MQHHPERLYDAINANELGAIITEHRNLLLCSLLRPILDTFEQEGIQMSAVLRALATLAQQRSGTLSAADSSNPWLQCEALLREAQAMATMAEQRPQVTAPGGEGDRNAALDYLAQAGRPQTANGDGEAIANGNGGFELDSDGDGLDISQLTANMDLSKLRADLENEGELGDEGAGDDTEIQDAQPDSSGKAVGQGSNGSNGEAIANASSSLTDIGSVDWSQVGDDEAWARELLEEN